MKGATIINSIAKHVCIVSIHAPVKGATPCTAYDVNIGTLLPFSATVLTNFRFINLMVD